MIPGIVAGGGAGGYSPPHSWTPADLNPLEWWDVSDGATVDVVSGAIAAIYSKGSGGRTASNSDPATRPAFSAALQNGRDAAVFNGSSHFLNIAALATDTPMWVAQVFGRASSGIKSQTLGGATGSVPPYAAQWWTDNIRYSALWGTSSGYATHGGVSTATGVFQHVLAKGGSTTQLYQDGDAIGAPQTNLSGSGNLVYIGRRAGDYHAGLLCEIIVGTSALSESDRQKMEGYLAHKWGLAGSLPLSHPYKDAPP